MRVVDDRADGAASFVGHRLEGIWNRLHRRGFDLLHRHAQFLKQSSDVGGLHQDADRAGYRAFAGENTVSPKRHHIAARGRRLSEDGDDRNARRDVAQLAM